MKEIILIFLLIASICYPAAITDLAGLKTNFAAGGSHTMAGGTYTLDADVTCGAALVITMAGDGAVTIDGNDSFRIIIDGTVATFTGDATNTITFTQGDTDCVSILGTAAGATATFTYCNFTEAAALNGLTVSGSLAGATTVTCTNCNAVNNDNDGFSILDTADTNTATMTLTNCTATGSDPLGSGGGSGDGATSHLLTHYLYINGGSYYDNGKMGIVSVGGSLVVTGASAYGNGVVQTGYEIYASGTLTNVIIDSCELECQDSTSSISGILINAGAAFEGVMVSDCLILNSNTGVMSHAIYIADTNTKSVTVTGCVFANFDTASTYGIYTPSGSTANITVKNCTFYNCETGILIRANQPNLIYNNIFMNCDSYGIYDYTGYYSDSPANGYNDFYGNAYTTKGVKDSARSLHSTDLTSDPKFTDAANDDYTLKPDSPCLNAGRPTVHSGYSTIGAWGPKWQSLSRIGN